jgi:hypothetical protein
MALSDDFREQLKAGNITEALALALGEAVELKITTWVASAEDDEADKAKPGHRLRTRINLIEGDIENEIGDQFLSNGRYRELHQFHLEQVAEGNKIIHNNLKSLQKLFEALVALRYQQEAPPSIELDSPPFENELLAPSDAVTDTDVVIEPPESVVEDSMVIPHTVTDEAIIDTGVVINPPESVVEDTVFPNTLTETEGATDADVDIEPPLVVEDSAVIADTATEEEAAKAPPLPFEEQSSLPTTSVDSTTDLESETDEDNWDDSVLDLLESLRVVSLSDEQPSSIGFGEDWERFVEQELESEPTTLDSQENPDWATFTLEDLELPPTSPAANIEASDSQTDEDWGDLVEIETEPVTLEASPTQEVEVFSLDDFESPPTSPATNVEAPDAEIDEDWGDLVESESEPINLEAPATHEVEVLSLDDFDLPPTSPTPNIEAPDAEIDEDWGDLVEPESEPATLEAPATQEVEVPSFEDFEPSTSSVPNVEAPDVEIDEEDWGDLVEIEPEPATSEAPATQAVEVLTFDDSEPPPTSPTPNIEAPDAEIDEDWGDLVEIEPEPATSEAPATQEVEVLAFDDFDSPPTSPTPNIEAPDEEIDDEDWGDLVEPESEPTTLEARVNQEAVVPSFKEFEPLPTSPTSNIEVLGSQTDEDWGDLVEPEPTPEPSQPIPSLDSLNLEEDEAWDEWVVEEPESIPDVPVTDIEALDLGEDEDWGDLEEDTDPFAAPSTLDELLPDVDINEDWDEFSAQELEPYSANPDPDSEFDLSQSLDDLTLEEAASSATEDIDLSESLDTDSSAEQSGFEESDDFLEEITEPQQDSAIDPIDALFEDDEPKSVEKRVPPPPPRDRFPNQNN